MIFYVLRRLISIVPTLIAVSLITFWLSNLVPGDPVENLVGGGMLQEESSHEQALWMDSYKRTAAQYHYDKPKFYFSIQPVAYPDTLYKIQPQSARFQAINLIKEYGSWRNVSAFGSEVDKMLHNDHHPEAMYLVKQLSTAQDPIIIQKLVNQMAQEFSDWDETMALKVRLDNLTQSSRLGLLRPKLVWHGVANQYHYWISGILHGDFGQSFVDKKPVTKKFLEALPTTLWLGVSTLLVSIFFGVGIGLFLVYYSGHWLSRLLSLKMYGVLAMPVFWLASLLILFFATGDVASWLNIFPSEGFGIFPEGASLWQKINIRTSHLVLPVLSLALPTGALIAIYFRRNLEKEMEKNYIKTAILKNISPRRVLWKHGAQNALVSMVSLFGNVLPGLIGGSVVIEVIFNIPGMGRLLLLSILSKDWPVVFGLVLVVGFLTIISLLIMDLLYTRVDPRVRLRYKIKGDE